MENAVKALLIAAGVLIGLMIISLGVNLYSTINEIVEDINEEINITEIKKFNEQFLKYINYNSDGDKQFVLTIHDVVTAANLAYEINQKGDTTVEVKLGQTSIADDINVKLTELLEKYKDKEYKCTNENVRIDLNTGKVCEITFFEE